MKIENKNSSVVSPVNSKLDESSPISSQHSSPLSGSFFDHIILDDCKSIFSIESEISEADLPSFINLDFLNDEPSIKNNPEILHQKDVFSYDYSFFQTFPTLVPLPLYAYPASASLVETPVQAKHLITYDKQINCIKKSALILGIIAKNYELSRKEINFLSYDSEAFIQKDISRKKNEIIHHIKNLLPNYNAYSDNLKLDLDYFNKMIDTDNNRLNFPEFMSHYYEYYINEFDLLKLHDLILRNYDKNFSTYKEDSNPKFLLKKLVHDIQLYLWLVKSSYSFASHLNPLGQKYIKLIYLREILNRFESFKKNNSNEEIFSVLTSSQRKQFYIFKDAFTHCDSLISMINLNLDFTLPEYSKIFFEDLFNLYDQGYMLLRILPDTFGRVPLFTNKDSKYTKKNKY